MKIDSLHAQLATINKRRKALELRIESRQLKRLLALPASVGAADMDLLIVALIPLSSAALRRKLKAAGFDDTSDSATAKAHEAGNGSGNGIGNGTSPRTGRARNKRAHFTEELKGRVKAELETGKKTVAALSKEYGPSHPTIMSWKRDWGMTRPHARSDR